MSPTLFNLFVEDLPSYLGVTIGERKIDHLFFADNLVLRSETNTGLQSLINGLEIFCSQWYMVVNLTKTKVMIFHKKYIKVRDMPKFTLNDARSKKPNFVITLVSLLRTQMTDSKNTSKKNMIKHYVPYFLREALLMKHPVLIRRII